MGGAATNPVIRVSDAHYRFPGSDVLSLSVPEFSVERGEHTAIVGPSGCGKTTLLRLIAGILLPQRGTIRVLGAEAASLSPRARGRQRLRSIGMVFQDFALLDYLSAIENIVLTARLGGLEMQPAREHARQLAGLAGIAHTLNRRPGRLSQGERQRVAVCRALVTKPPLIVCDEPTGNLDPKRSSEIMKLVMRAADEIDATVITVTHDQSILSTFTRSVDLSEIATLEGDGR